VNVAHVYPEVLNNDFQKFIYEAFFGWCLLDAFL
jgi:hypothetical protein